jgi:hypothetical protein
VLVAYTFDLVPTSGVLALDEGAFNGVRYHLLEFQPATRVRVLSDPPRIRVRAQGRVAEVAPGLLAQIEEFAGTSLEVVLVRRW